MNDLRRLERDPGLKSSPGAQARLVRELWGRGEQSRLLDLVLDRRVEAMLRRDQGGSIHFRSEALSARGSALSLSLACGALELPCAWGNAERRRYCADAARRVLGLIEDAELREHWGEVLEWSAGRGHHSEHLPPRGRLPHVPSATFFLHTPNNRAISACSNAVHVTASYAPERVSRCAAEAVSHAAGIDAYAIEKRWQTRRILEIMLEVDR